MREKNRKPIESVNKFPQFITMNVIDGQAGLIIYSGLIFYSLTIDNILNIIILLILAGISIATLGGENGLFTRAKQAKSNTLDAQNAENQVLTGYESKIDEVVGGSGGGTTGETLASKVQVGDYVQYTPDAASTDSILTELGTYSGSTENTSSTLTQESSLNWRVLDVKDGKVRLISEFPTTSRVSFLGHNGYNNAVYLLDKTCNTLYNNSTVAENVQNLKIEDIQDKMNVTDYSTISSSYGTTFSPTNKYYPSIFLQEKDQTVSGSQPSTRLSLSEQTTPITSEDRATSWTVKYTYWYKSMAETDFTNSKYYNLFLYNGSHYSTYWMSSRCVSSLSGDACFSVRRVSSGDMSANHLYTSRGYSYVIEGALRPVITLKSNVQIDTTDSTKDGTAATNAYVIK